MPPPRKPINQLAPDALERAPRLARARVAEPLYPPLQKLAPPEHLNPRAQEHWNHFAPLLVGQDVLTEADVQTLTMYCKCLADEEEVANVIRVDGWVIPTPKEGMIRHPLCTLLTTLRAQVKAFGEQLGLSPSSRARTKGASQEEQPEPDGFDAI